MKQKRKVRTVTSKAVGPVYSLTAMEELLGLSITEVTAMAETGELLALPVQNNLLFSIFQFDGQEVRHDIIDIAKILTEAADPFTAAAWLHAPAVMAGNGETSNEEFMRTNPVVVRAAAQDMAARWAA